MARPAREAALARSLATDFAIVAGVNAKARLERAVARKRGDRRLVINRGGIHRRALRARRFTRWRSLRPGSPAIAALRTRANRKNGNLAQTKTTLRRKNHSRCSLQSWVRGE